MSQKSLKSQNMKWLVMLGTADLIVILLFLVPSLSTGASLEELGSWKLLTTVAIPIAILLTINVLPHTIKSALVYWKPIGWLPGSESFTKYAPRDPRISMKTLAANVGELPTDSKEQNAKWYSLYKMVETLPEVEEAQKNFLMYRDMAVLSLPFIVLAPFTLHFAGAESTALWFGSGLFSVQFLLTALSARWSGIRFVTNVLAIHSSRKVPPPESHA